MKTITDIQANRDITKAYLKENGFDIVLTRPIRASLPSGGFTTVPSELEVQRFAIIGPQAGLRRAPEVPANVGQIASYNLTLLGFHDADVHDNDEFILDEGKYRVDFVFPDRSFRTASVVVYEGRIGA